MNNVAAAKAIRADSVNNISSPILILGSERSGTNLLRAMLCSHSEIVSPPPAGFIDALMPIQARYFPTGKPAHLSQLIDDVIVMTRTHHNPWDISLDADVIRERIGDKPSLLNIFSAINDIYAEMKDRRLWVSKEPGLFKYIREVVEHIPDAKFIYLARDGRDVALSMLHGHVHEFHIYYAAHNWAAAQRQCLDAMADPSMRSRIHFVKYENLIANPYMEVSNMMRFIGASFESAQLDYHNNKSVVMHASKSRFWKNLAKPIDSKNMGLYKKKLSIKDIHIFETVARKELNALGYKAETVEDMTIGLRDIRNFEINAKIKRLIWSLDPRIEARRSRKRVATTLKIINRNLV